MMVYKNQLRLFHIKGVNNLTIPFTIGAINVNSQNTNAAISVGENQLTGWASHRKTNNGVGIQVGPFANMGNVSFIYDTDVVDGQMNDQDLTPGVQSQLL